MRAKKQLLSLCVGLALLPVASLGVSEEDKPKKSTSIFAEMENPELTALAKRKLDMTLFCAPIANDEIKQAVYADMREAKWDRFGMSCALQYGGEIIEDDWLSAFAIEDKLNLLGDHITYFEVLDKQYNAHYQGGDLTIELGWRWERNRIQALKLLDDVEMFEPLIPEITVLKAAYTLASTMRESDTREMMEASIKARGLLDGVVEDSPEVIDGLPLLMLAQLLLALPEFSGGDPIRAIELLEQGMAIDPENLSFHRWLIEGLVAERENAAAIDILRKAADVPVEASHPQDYVDMAKVLGGIAVRLGEKDIAAHFSKNRQQLLSKKPYLLARKARASVGHGGANPITGELKNEI
ncbi:hypothetical protein R50073_17380 [Maricurvus nonylphenolicus]|uniref:tetratricopeptide repeat protein n=1 Tax=Maricurvus nonylphenolicus TaxID=1008307 RepID=UPI0036F20646